ncbi:hypothetical protein [Nocardioides aequoreus]|uniref:hypothetical protein n=1 Tax=Nocardioides aequoreus TaxID=397278 RepID=UPI0004C3CC92|nr:hypothetical protein [Nocardioides aequoreus]
MSTHTPGPRTAVATTRAPSYAALIGTVYVVNVLVMSLSITAEIALGYVGSGDQPRSLGEQLAGVLGFGTLGLVVSLVGARYLSGRRAQAGAIGFGVLCVPALAFFWCGMPGMLGATAAHLAGLTRGGEPLRGTARSCGVVGLVLAVANPLLTAVLVGGSWASELL